MQFLSPGVLWALAALAVPILLHLFYFRRFRKVAFTNVRFLREVKEETQRRSRLRNLLVLALRLVAFGALVLAFAQPFLGGGDPDAAAAPARVAVVVDNSRSMAAQSADVSLLEKAKQRARELIRAHGEATEFQLITNDLDGASSRWLTQEDALGSLDEIGFGASPQAGSALLRRVLTTAGEAPPTYVLSDFQTSQYDLGELTAETSLRPVLVPLTAVETRNVAIDSAYLLRPVQLVGEPVEVAVALTNYGDADAEAVRLSALVEGNTQPFGLRSVPAGATLRDTVTLSVTRPGFTRAELRITDFPIEFDDRYFVAFEVRDRLSVLVIADGEVRPELAAAFPEGSPLRLSSNRTSNVDYSALPGYDLIVLDGPRGVPSGLVQSLAGAAAAGAKVLVFPGAGAANGADGYAALLTALGLPPLGLLEEGDFEGARLNTQSFVFSDVYERLPRNTRLPRARARFALRGAGAEPLLSFRDGRPFLVAASGPRGTAYLSAAPLDPDASDLARRGEVFVPMLYRMAFSGGTARAIAQTIGAGGALEVSLPPEADERALRMRSAEASFVPAQRRTGRAAVLSFGQAPERPGHYDVVDGADSTVAAVAFNLDRRESPMSFHDPADLAAAGLTVYDGDTAGALDAALATGTLGTPWWPYLVAVALAALLAESLVLRFWRPGRGAVVVSTPGAAVASAE